MPDIERTFEITVYVTISAENAAEAENYLRDVLAVEPGVERVNISTVRTLRKPSDAR